MTTPTSPRCVLCSCEYNHNVKHYGKDAPPALGDIQKHTFIPAYPLRFCNCADCNDKAKSFFKSAISRRIAAE